MTPDELQPRDFGAPDGPRPWCRDSGDRAQAFLHSLGPLDRVVHEPTWGAGLLMTLVLTDERPPDDLVVSTRCVVTTGDEVLVCHTPHGAHLIPGGRREVGETWEETARREVREETGYELGPLTPLAVVLLHRDERPDDPGYAFPHPDGFWVVYAGAPATRPTDGWVDTEGWEMSSALVATVDAAGLDLTPIDQSLLRAIAMRSA